MKINDFIWDDGNIDHIARHGVTPDEAEEVFVNRPKFFKSRQERYAALGKSSQGRYLFVVFLYQGKGCARVVTARNMTKTERRLYQK